MDFMEENGAEQVINDYIEREISEYRRASERELAFVTVTPEAKEAFYRKPYYIIANTYIGVRGIAE